MAYYQSRGSVFENIAAVSKLEQFRYLTDASVHSAKSKICINLYLTVHIQE